MEKKSFATHVMEEAETKGILKSKVLTLMLREELIAALDEKINSFSLAAEPSSIHTQEAILEIRDTATGCIFRRQLPLEVEENATALRLKGENASNQNTEIIFYSHGGADRLGMLMGQGPDEDPCGGHTDHEH
ncbi:MAG: hypothetical protein ACOX0U_06740 [Oscillospiraceae bacterium]|jgi:hypothetical protein